MSFAPFNTHSSCYFHNCNILKFCGIINIEASYNTSRFGRKSVICSATVIWNLLQNKYNHDFMKVAPRALKSF